MTRKTRNRPKGKRWWNNDCLTAQNRNRFWFSIWSSCGRPRDGAVYESNMHAKHMFRKTCRNAADKSTTFSFSSCDTLFKHKRMKVFWNRIKSARNPKENNYNSISLHSLEQHFENKFSYDSENESAFIDNARTEGLNHLDRCDNYNSSFALSERCIRKYVSDMKSGSTPGID